MNRMDEIRKERAIQEKKERYLEFLRGIEGTPFRKLSLSQRQWLKDNHPYLYNKGVEHSEEPVRNLLYLDKAKQKKKEINVVPVIVQNQKEEEKESAVLHVRLRRRTGLVQCGSGYGNRSYLPN